MDFTAYESEINIGLGIPPDNPTDIPPIVEAEVLGALKTEGRLCRRKAIGPLDTALSASALDSSIVKFHLLFTVHPSSWVPAALTNSRTLPEQKRLLILGTHLMDQPVPDEDMAVRTGN